MSDNPPQSSSPEDTGKEELMTLEIGDPQPAIDGTGPASLGKKKKSLGRQVRIFILMKILRPPVVALGRTRGIRYVAPAVRTLDRVLFLWSRGCVTAVGLAGLPSMILSVKGRRSGKTYRIPLLCSQWGDGYVIVGSNWGREKHPAWSSNLIANPVVTANIRGRETTMKSRLLAGSERDLVWPLLVQNWSGYESYARRLDRELRVFALEPAAGRTRADGTPDDKPAVIHKGDSVA
jgi:deazaflavin-dependent oxidoreductase (nitroreductase family)